MFDKFLQISKRQNGDTTYLTKAEKYPKLKYQAEIKSNTNGFLKTINTFVLGMLTLVLVAGSKTKEDKIEPKAGILFNYKIGDSIKKGDVITEIFSDNKNKLKDVEENLLNALTFSKTKVKKSNLIKEIIR